MVELLRRAARESDRKRVLSNHCSAAVITLSPLVTVLLSELVCNTRVISPNDLSRLPHLRTSECGWHEWKGVGGRKGGGGGQGRKMNKYRKERRKEKSEYQIMRLNWAPLWDSSSHIKCQYLWDYCKLSKTLCVKYLGHKYKAAEKW